MRKILFFILLIPTIAFSQGSELLNNGGFANGDNWTINNNVPAGWVISGGVASFDNAGGNAILTQTDANMVASIKAETRYTLTFDLVGTAGIFFMSSDVKTYIDYTIYTTGSKSLEFVTPADIGAKGFRLYAYPDGDFTIDNISLIENAPDGGDPYYVAVDGNDAASGDITHPWATWQKAANMANIGDTVYFRGGVWYPTASTYDYAVMSINVTEGRGHSGLPKLSVNGDREIYFLAYPGETPILDCSRVNIDNQVYNYGIYIKDAHFINFKGLQIRNVYQKRSNVSARGVYSVISSNLTFENMVIHDLGGGAYNILTDADVRNQGLGWGGNNPDYITYDTTRFINCDVYNICDSLYYQPGNMGDGFKSWSDEGEGEYFYFYGCRAWNCSDEGWDITSNSTIIIENCWSFNNGKQDIEMPEGWYMEGNGFKFGAPKDSVTYVNCVVKNSIAAYNNGFGFDLSDPEGFYKSNARIFNNTSYYNDQGYVTVSTNTSKPWILAKVYNNISYQDNSIGQFGVYQHYTERANTWDATANHGSPYNVVTDTVTVTDADFVSVDSTGLTAARQSDGSLPYLNFLRLASGSDLIDAGFFVPDVPAQLSQDTVGSAPDIGAYEYDSSPDETYAPTAVTSAASSVKSVQALLGGNTLADGGAAITARGIVWGTSANPTTANNVVTVSGTTGSYTITLTGLTSNTTYHVRSYATNSAGTSYGANVEFTTPKYTIAKSGTKLFIKNGKILVIQ